MNLRRRSAVATIITLTALGSVAAGCGGGGSNSRASADARRPRASVALTVPDPTAVPTAADAAAGDHRYAVGVRTDTAVDPSRPTSAVDGYPGAPDRSFPVTFWYPAAGDPDGAVVADAPPARGDGPFPLVLFSHGYAVTPDVYESLLARWAAAGYVVAAPAYPLLSGVPAGPSHEDFDEVIADADFVLGEVLADLGTPTGPHPLAGMVDPAHVATAGQSDGLIPAYGLGFLQCCRDPRVDAVVAMAGIIGNVNNPVTRDSGLPVLHLVGEADEIQPYAQAIVWDRDNLTPPRWMLTLVGGGHSPPYRDPASPHFEGVVETTTAFLDGTIGGRTARLAAIDDYVAAHPDRFRLER